MTYEKSELLAQNDANGSFASHCQSDRKVPYRKPDFVAENKAEGNFNAGCPEPVFDACFACERLSMQR